MLLAGQQILLTPCQGVPENQRMESPFSRNLMLDKRFGTAYHVSIIIYL